MVKAETETVKRKRKTKRTTNRRRSTAKAQVSEQAVKPVVETPEILSDAQRIDALIREINELTAKRLKEESKVTQVTTIPEPVIIQGKPDVTENIVEPKPKDITEPKPAKQFDTRLLELIGGLLTIAAAIGSGALWMQNERNQMLAMLTIGLFGGGVYLLYRYLHKPDTSTVIVMPGSTGGKVTKVTGPVNSLNIYAQRDDATGIVFPEKVSFEWVEHPLGQPWHCLNTDKHYFVHRWDIDRSALVPFVLPDAKYTDPALLAEYLSLEDEKRYMRHRPSLMHYIGPAIMGIMVGVGFLVIIILGG